MDIGPPPPPPIFAGSPPTTTTDTVTPQFYNNGVSHHRHSSPPSSSSPASSIIIVMIVIFSVIIFSAIIYLLIRFFSHRFRTPFSFSNGVVFDNRNGNEHVTEHVIAVTNNGVDSLSLSLPLFTFSSLTGKITGGDCAVCLSKFEDEDQLRLLPLCCHAFHAQCIDVWLKSNVTCPLCRSTVNPTEADILNRIASGSGGGGNRSNSFRIEIGTVSRRRDPADSRRSYSVGSYEYVLDDDYEIPVESTLRRAVSDRTSVDKDSTIPEPPESPAGQNLGAEVAVDGGGGNRNWLRDYVDRVSVSLSSRTISFRDSGRFFTGSSRRSETVDDFEATHGRVGEEISELFRWFSGV